jgi:uncharacterized protein
MKESSKTMDGTRQSDAVRAEKLAKARIGIANLLESVPAIVGAFLATDDGFELTQMIAGRDVDSARLAAMSSSMIALSHAIVVEIELGETENLLIEAKLGKVLLLSLATEPKLSLTVISKPSATLGQVLFASRECAKQIELLFA